MAYFDTIETYVGQFDEKKIRLSGIKYEPFWINKGTIIFIEGISGKVEDYNPFLRILGDTYKVIAFNLRGHGQRGNRSKGLLKIHDSKFDLIEIYSQFSQKNKTVLIGHSLGSVISLGASKLINPQALIFICPYINRDYLENLPGKLIRFLDSNRNLTKGLDTILSKLPMDKLLGMNMDYPLQSFSELNNSDMNQITSNDISPPLLYFISNRDEVLGINDEKSFNRYQEAIRKINTNLEDGSEAIDGLNHCLNLKKGDLSPFFNPETGKDREKVFKKIHEFLEKYIPYTPQKLDISEGIRTGTLSYKEDKKQN